MKMDYILFDNLVNDELTLLDMSPCPVHGGGNQLYKFQEYYKAIYGESIIVICCDSLRLMEQKARIRG